MHAVRNIKIPGGVWWEIILCGPGPQRQVTRVESPDQEFLHHVTSNQVRMDFLVNFLGANPYQAIAVPVVGGLASGSRYMRKQC